MKKRRVEKRNIFAQNNNNNNNKSGKKKRIFRKNAKGIVKRVFGGLKRMIF